jgi:chromosomal replication initiator protein
VSNWQDKFGGDGKTPAEPTSAQSATADTGVDTLLPNDPAQIWQQVQGKLRAVLGERVHMSWTGQLTLQSADETHVVLSAPSKFVVGRIDGKYGDLVRKLWAECDTRNVEIGSGVSKPQMKPPTQIAASQILPKAMLSPSSRVMQAGINSSQSQPQNQLQNQLQNKDRFTFENFVVGAPNELAFAVARRVASSQDSQYNPIIIHGPHGMGKTHLLHAVKAEAAKTNPSRRVHLISAENFVATFVQSVRAQGRAEIDAFKSSLRDVDLLIIDDAHFIADKPGSQEELMHTLISLVDSGKQILLACDRHPQAINKASDRLKSYLCGGLLCDIGAADYELRLRILDRLIERRRAGGHPALAMPSDARDHLAARINATPRDLEGAFNQVVARLEFLGKPLTLESIQEALAHSRYTGQVRPSVDKIQRATAKQFGISMEEMLSKRRARAIARPRQVAMYLAKMLTTRSLPDIGRRFGGRDHTTVIHAVKRIDQLRADDSGLNANIETLLEIFNS